MRARAMFGDAGACGIIAPPAAHVPKSIMDSSTPPPVTQLLLQWRAGDSAALANLTTLLYAELRSMAQQHVRRERSDHTLQGTALVNEAFVRLVKMQSVDVKSRAHFFALASTVMRRILVDHARARLSSKRGGDVLHCGLEIGGDTNISADDASGDSRAESGWGSGECEGLLVSVEASEEIAALDGALRALEAIDPRQAQIVEMRYFGGLTIEQTAQSLDISDATVKREWASARAWLRRELALDPT